MCCGYDGSAWEQEGGGGERAWGAGRSALVGRRGGGASVASTKGRRGEEAQEGARHKGGRRKRIESVIEVRAWEVFKRV